MSNWHRITNLDESNQLQWFQASEEAYELLFPANYREPWQNFKAYILDTEKRRKRESILDPEDFYYVAVADGITCGMIFFTVYASEHLAFVSYMGVRKAIGDYRIHSRTVMKMLGEMIEEIDVQVNKANCEGFLFELEAVYPEDLDLRRKATQCLTTRQRAVVERIRTTDAFQRRGARKLMWVNYYQPKLKWDWNFPEERMHLMFAPSGFTRSRAPEKITLTKSQVKRYVRFVYLTFYWEGYEASEKGPHRGTKLQQWKSYLEELYKSAVEALPNEVSMQPIDLAVSRPPVFISYRDEDKKLAQLAHEYLESLGFPVLYWGKNSRQSVGNRVWPTIYNWMNHSKFILILVTSNPLAEGQLNEAKYMHEHNYFCREDKIVLPIIVGWRVHPPSRREWIPTDLIYNKRPRAKFHQAMEEVADRIQKL